MLKSSGCYLLAAALLLSGCEARNLYVGHVTILGLDSAISTDQAAGHLTFGYDRNFVAVVPKSVPIDETAAGSGSPSKDDSAREAMAVLSCSEVQVKGIFLTHFAEYLATGRAALDFAKRISGKTGAATEEGQAETKKTGLDALKELFDCYQDTKIDTNAGGGN